MVRFPPLTPDSPLYFGKYKDQPVWYVIENDPGWVQWAIDNVDGFELNNEAYHELQKRQKRK